ncbi:MAG: STN domain-containing protein [Bacteroidia bacterium]|nr:STN domain-containing protein [Bacteroidia bacterium]MCF8426552.1 STN domain-containing protein [Bacteroidia bacterium]MCF8447329.1 STN domain-containing protein [Bacteroidia bacterium]
MRILLIALAFLFTVNANAQNYLAKPVTLNYQEVRIQLILDAIAKQTGVLFSYSGFNDKQKVSIQCSQMPLKQVLNLLLPQVNASYKQAERYIILIPKPVANEVEEDITFRIYPSLKGYVYDAHTLLPLKGVSVYNKYSKEVSFSESNGSFSLENKDRFNPYPISFAKENYLDTNFLVLNPGDQSISIYLHVVPKPAPKNKVKEVLSEPNENNDTSIVLGKPFDFLVDYWKSVKDKNLNFKNINDTLHSEYSVSFIPFLSTNGSLGFNTVNKYSFNILAGYSKGVEAFEIGGLANLVAGDVKYVQVAGLANLVEGKTEGTQVAGLLNFNGAETHGVQVGGLFNVVDGDFSHVQVGGLGNWVSGNVSGVQVGGLANYNEKETQGVQVGGLVNMNLKTTRGVQVAGIANSILDSLQGFQFAGIGNFTQKHVGGVQVAGIANVAPCIKGTQVAGIVNLAQKVEGSQVGLLNFSDTCIGIPVGFMSYVNKGYHKFELATDEKLLTTVSFRTGVEMFHNIFILGTQFGGNHPVWTYGYGVGTQSDWSDNWKFGMDLTVRHLIPNTLSTPSLDLLGKFDVHVVYQIGNRFEIVLGPTANFSLFDKTGDNFKSHFRAYPPSYFYTNNFGNFTSRGWIGVKVGVRFF